MAAVAFAITLTEEVESAKKSGAKTLAEVATELNDAGFRTRAGARWAPGTVHRLLRRLNQSRS